MPNMDEPVAISIILRPDFRRDYEKATIYPVIEMLQGGFKVFEVRIPDIAFAEGDKPGLIERRCCIIARGYIHAIAYGLSRQFSESVTEETLTALVSKYG